MNQLVAQHDPIALIIKATSERDSGRLERMKKILELSYRFPVLRAILDFAATIVHDGRLQFIVAVKQNYELDAGNCQTHNALENLLNKVRSRHRYTITLKRIDADVLIHEICHMLEKELQIDLAGFKQVLTKDWQSGKVQGSVARAVQEVMWQPVEAYPKNEQMGELFVRYFELLVLSKDISGMAASAYQYSVDEFVNSLPETTMWLQKHVLQKLAPLTLAEISRASNKYIEQKVVHKWTDAKVESLHPKGKPQWSKTIKSIKS